MFLRPSSAVLAANEQLKKIRERLGIVVRSTAVSAISDAPNYALENGRKQLDLYRRRDGILAKPKPAQPFFETKPEPEKRRLDQREPRQARLPLDGETVKHYADLGLAALDATEGSIYRVWLLCRFMDKNGRGWLPVQQLREQLTKKEAKLRICGWRRLRQILAAGEGGYWQRKDGRLWLCGATAVARYLQVERLNGRPIALPIQHITGGIGEFHAHLYGAWHSGRRTENPISRETQRDLLGVPARTQRHYCRVAEIERTENYAIGGKHSPETVQEAAWAHEGTFPFIDKRGYQGKKNQQYIAWQLPSSHKARHSTARRGRQRKINRQLTVDLVNHAAQGNGGTRIDKLFFQNGAEAAKAYNKQGGTVDTYWPQTQTHKRKRTQAELWTCLSS